MNWHRVAQALEDDARGIRQRAEAAFAGDFQTQQEMRTRASLLESLSRALHAGADEG